MRTNSLAKRCRSGVLCVSLAILLFVASGDATWARSDDLHDGGLNERTVTLAMRSVDLSEVMAMLARSERINILLADDVEATVSFNLYDVPLVQAIESIADAAGFAVERRAGTYFIVDRGEVGNYTASELTAVRTFKIQYADPAVVQGSLQPYLSEYGQITSIPERNLLMIEDRPEFLRRLAALIREIDRTPRQILIEAKILEITLDDEDSYGVEWSDFFRPGDGEGSAGTRGFADSGNSGTQGTFISIANSEFSLMLSALETDGRVRTLSTPKLLALENEESSVIVGDRRGYPVTTTINQVTTESIEFLESGVILNVTPSVDRDGRVMMDIHPEVSTGVIDVRGIPSQTTTEVTTQLLVESGQTVFIGGLIKHTQSENRSGVPVIGKVPGIGRLFSSVEKTNTNTETIVLITPRIVAGYNGSLSSDVAGRVNAVEAELDEKAAGIRGDLDPRSEDDRD